MKCLSVRPPWSWALFHGKPVENRTWQDPHRGPLLIHASQKFDKEGYLWLHNHQRFLLDELPSPSSIVRGAIVGQVEMFNCVLHDTSAFFFGPYGWLFRDQREFEDPIPWKGQLNLFNVPDEVMK